MKRFSPIFFLCLILPVTSGAFELVSSGGKSIHGELKAFDGETVDFIRDSDQKSFSVPISSLSKETVEAVELWRKNGGGLSKEFEVEVNTGRTRRTTAREDFDDKRVNIEPSVMVTNKHSATASKPVKLTILFLGRPVHYRSDIHVFSSKTYELPSVQPLSTINLKHEKISQPYDDSDYAQFGNSYLGYVWIIHEEKEGSERDAIITSGSVPSSYADKFSRALLSAKAGQTYTKDMQER